MAFPIRYMDSGWALSKHCGGSIVGSSSAWKVNPPKPFAKVLNVTLLVGTWNFVNEIKDSMGVTMGSMGSMNQTGSGAMSRVPRLAI